MARRKNEKFPVQHVILSSFLYRQIMVFHDEAEASSCLQWYRVPHAVNAPYRMIQHPYVSVSISLKRYVNAVSFFIPLFKFQRELLEFEKKQDLENQSRSISALFICLFYDYFSVSWLFLRILILSKKYQPQFFLGLQSNLGKISGSCCYETILIKNQCI